MSYQRSNRALSVFATAFLADGTTITCPATPGISKSVCARSTVHIQTSPAAILGHMPPLQPQAALQPKRPQVARPSVEAPW